MLHLGLLYFTLFFLFISPPPPIGVVVLNLHQVPPLGLWHEEQVKEEHEEDHAGEEPEEAVDADGDDEKWRHLDHDKTGHKLKEEEYGVAKAAGVGREKLTLKNKLEYVFVDIFLLHVFL